MAKKAAAVGKRTRGEEALQRIRRVRDALQTAKATIPGLIAELDELEARAEGRLEAVSEESKQESEG